MLLLGPDKMISSMVSANRKICRHLERLFPKFFGEPRDCNADQLKLIDGILLQSTDLKILEVGGVDRPLLPISEQYFYVGMDIDDKPTCYRCYDEFIVQSIEDTIAGEFDLIISTTLLEHVPNNSVSVKSMYDALVLGGTIIHYVPSKNHFYSVCLRLVGPKLQKILIKYLRPEAAAITGYPAFFDNCSPSEMEKLCLNKGFKDVDVICYYKATDYFAFFLPAYLITSVLENFFEYFNFSFFSSGFIIIAKK